MGQYYQIYYKKDGKVTIFDRSVNGEYTMAKLMEHSWWENPLVNTICKKLYKKPATIAWVGDYAEDSPVYEDTWEGAKTSGVRESQLRLNGKFLCNHTKKQFLCADRYYAECGDSEGWCVHPLPLLVAQGNGLGGGDYHGINEDSVGIWALDEISVEDERPADYEQIFVTFKEEW